MTLRNNLKLSRSLPFSFSPVASVIITPPNDTIVVQPDNATFICEATARPRPSMFWRRVSEDGTQSMLMTGDKYIIDSTQTFGDRERRSVLTVVETYPEDAGGFVCLAVNEAGNAEDTAELTIYGKSHAGSCSRSCWYRYVCTIPRCLN